MTLRSIATPTAPATRKASGNGDDQRAVEQARRAGADQLLHDEGGVGAEHHHLAMRHVDDAHHAEGDGEADRGEQQHRAEARGRNQTFCSARHRAQALLDRGCMPGRGGGLDAHPARRPAGAQQGRARPASPRSRESRDGRRARSASRRVGRREDDRGPAPSQSRARRRRRSPWRAPPRATGSAPASRDLNTACAASSAHAPDRAEQASARRAPRRWRGAGGC